MKEYFLYATKAIAAEGVGDITQMETYLASVYNYFVHNPQELLHIQDANVIGTAFYLHLQFNGEKGTMEVNIENAFICFYQSIFSDDTPKNKSLAAIRLFILFNTNSFQYLVQQIYRIFGAPQLHFQLPMATVFSRPPEEVDIIVKSESTDETMCYAKAYLYDLFINSITYNTFSTYSFQGEVNVLDRSCQNFIELSNQISNNLPEQVKKGEIVLKMIYDKLTDEIKKYISHSE